jgi:hypothetical protein
VAFRVQLVQCCNTKIAQYNSAWRKKLSGVLGTAATELAELKEKANLQ